MISEPNRSDLLEAHERLSPHIHKTSIMRSSGLEVLGGCRLFFKCENFQKTGSFKARGATNAVLTLREKKTIKEVVAHSSGNHAQALARAAGIAGMHAHIVMPYNASEVKKKAVKSLGGTITECAPGITARDEAVRARIEKTGAHEIHPFNNYDVIAGQATATLELLYEIGELDDLVVPVGGGGLLSGALLAVKYFSPRVRVIAGEPEGADDAFRSLKSGRLEQSQANTIADGLLTSLGDKTFSVIREGVEEIITVRDEEIIAAMQLLWERMKIIVEPSGAVSFAALMKRKEKFVNRNVGIILSGGNINLKRLDFLFEPTKKQTSN